MPESEDYTFQLLDEDGRIAVSLDCAKCGYDLRGRRMDERCSECGEPVWPSAQFGELRIGRPGPARVVRTMARLLQVASAMVVMLPIAFPVLPFGPFVYGLIVLPSLSLLVAFIAVRLALIRAQSVVAAIAIAGLAVSFFAWSAALFASRQKTLEGAKLTMIAWIIVYFLGQFATIVQFARIEKLLGIGISSWAVNCGVLRRSVGWQALFATCLVLFVVCSDPNATLAPIIFAAAIIAFGWQWVFSFALMAAASAIRAEVRAPPKAKWLESRQVER